MSRHSKWAKIKRGKGLEDKKRGQIFTKIGRMITVAVKEGGGDNPEANFKLRLALEQAKAANMPKETIERALSRGKGEESKDDLESIIYEAIGPAGLVLIIEALTDNKNRTFSEIKHLLSEHGGSVAGQGSVLWQFKKCGTMLLKKESYRDRETTELQIIEAGAEDIEEENGDLLVYTKPELLQKVKNQLEAAGFKVEEAEILFMPKETIIVADSQSLQQISNLIDAIDEHPDVNNVYTNLKD